MKPVNSIGLIWKGFWRSWHSSLFVQIIFPTQCQRSARKMPFLVARPRFVSFRSGWTLAWKWIQRTMQKMKNGLKIWKFIMKLILLASGGCHQYNAMLCIAICWLTGISWWWWWWWWWWWLPSIQCSHVMHPAICWLTGISCSASNR